MLLLHLLVLKVVVFVIVSGQLPNGRRISKKISKRDTNDRNSSSKRVELTFPSSVRSTKSDCGHGSLITSLTQLKITTYRCA